MGGSPSERKMSNTKDDRAQRYIQNKKGRTSFFLYSRPTISPNTSIQRVPASTGTNQQQIAVPMNMKPNTTKNPSLSQSQPPMLLEMEVVSSSSDSEESDDNFSSTSDDAIFSSKAAIRRRRRRRSNADLVTAATATFGPITVVGPHIATRVQFTNVEIRSYTITIGDHPCCTIGCPITLDWEFTIEDTVSLNDYETHKYATIINSSNQSMTPTKMNDLRISPEERVELLLLSSKLSELEIRRASRKFHRSKNCSLRQCERIHETFFHCSKDFHADDDDDDEMDDDVQEKNGSSNNRNNGDDDSMSSNNTDDEK